MANDLDNISLDKTSFEYRALVGQPAGPRPTGIDTEDYMLAGNGKYHRMHMFAQSALKTVTNTTAETNLNGTGIGSMTLHANTYAYPGKMVQFMAMGPWTKDATSSSLTLRINITPAGGSPTTMHTKVLSNSQLNAGGASPRGGHWEISMMSTCYSVGVTGSMMMHGMLQMLDNTSNELVGTHTESPLITLDTTIEQTISVTAQWSAADTGLVISCSNLVMH